MRITLSLIHISIDVKGESSRLETEQVLQLLDESGFKVGAPVFLQDYQSLKLMLMREFDNFAFVTINVLGSKAEVEITQRDMPPETIPSHVPCNIIAAEDGQIVTYETYNGIPQYKTGDAVKKGELLVSGVYDSKVIGYRLVHSNAKIMARTLKKINTFVPYQKTETSDTGNEKSFYYFTAFNKTFNLTFSPASPFENFRTETTQDDLSIGDNMVLPLSLGKVSYIEQKDKEKFLTDEEAETEAKRYLDELERLEIHDLIVENKDVNVIKTENGIFCEYVYTIIKDIAQKQEIYKNETS